MGLVVAAVGATWSLHASTPPSGTAVAEHTTQTGAPAAPALVPRAALIGRWRPGAPRRVVIPALAVVAPVVPIRVAAGTLVPPSDPGELGWWAQGALPGARHGTALVTGHTVHEGGGALDHLTDLRPGDRVLVRTDKGRIRYVVRRVAVYRKGTLAARAHRLFDQQGRGRLQVVTCGDWNGTVYLSNVVVTATPVRELGRSGQPVDPPRSAAR